MKRKSILERFFYCQCLTYPKALFKKNIALFLAFFFFSLQSVFAQHLVTGVVMDDKNQPVTGASIKIKGKAGGTTTDAEGRFSLQVPTDATLQVTSVGYNNDEVQLNGKTSITITMHTSTAQMGEVVVVGYGTQKRATVTGSVATVKGTDLAKSPATNLSNSFAGRLPGVTAVQASGEPGKDGSAIRIRGVNSYGNSDALIVIDGIPGRAGGLERLNPQDIESVSILKDAAAAIYGSRAANGVILVTTKRGRIGKPSVSYDFNYGLAQPTRTPKMASASEYATIMNELTIYDKAPSASEWAAALQAFKTTGTYTSPNGVQFSAPFSQTDIEKFANGSDPLRFPNTDWFKATLKTWSPQTKHNLQVNGGNENIRYLASAGYTNQDGLYKNSATGYKQFDLRLNVDARINKYINTSIGVLAREEYRRSPNGATDANGGTALEIFRMIMRGKPTDVAVWPNGLPGPAIENGTNPVVITTDASGYIKDKRDYFQTNGKVEILIPWVDGLKLTGTGSVDKLSLTQRSWRLPWTLNTWDRVTFEADGVTPKLTNYVASSFTDPRLTQNAQQELAINLIGTLDYNHNFGGSHAITALVGVQKEKVNSDGFSAFRRNFLSPAIDQLFAGGSSQQSISNLNISNLSDLYQRARLSYFGRAGYNYKEKYIAEFLFRYDGSYLFPKANRFGFFPGISAGWRVSEENFFQKNIRAVNNLKLRASWGQMGAEPYYPVGSALANTLAEYQYISTMGFGTYILNDQIAQTLLETVVPNNHFTWEVANNYNAGLDASFFNNKLSIELDYFYNSRSGILTYLGGSIPQTSGITDKLPPVNFGKMKNSGGEFKISYSNKSGGLTYNVGVNGGYAKNRIIDWNETPGIPDWQRTTGRPYGAFLLYQADGVFATQKDIDNNTIDYTALTTRLLPGDLKIKDYNRDGKITADDQVRLDKTNTPTFTYGVTANFTYKNFDLSFLFQGAMGGLQFIGRTESGDFGNFLQYYYDHRWTIDNPSSVNPRLNNRSSWYWNSTGTGGGNNDYYVKTNNYLRLKNLELGYTLPAVFGKRAGISNLHLYVNGLNLLTFDKIKVWDPESVSTSGQVYPQPRIINTGVRVTF